MSPGCVGKRKRGEEITEASMSAQLNCHALRRRAWVLYSVCIDDRVILFIVLFDLDPVWTRCPKLQPVTALRRGAPGIRSCSLNRFILQMVCGLLIEVAKCAD
jgi:hypothetical protein